MSSDSVQVQETANGVEKGASSKVPRNMDEE